MEITSHQELDEAIEQLSKKSKEQKIVLKAHFNEAVESLKPVNLLKSAVGNIAEHPGIASAAIGTTVGVGAGVLSKKIIVGKSTNIFRRILGTAVEYAVARGISGNAGFIADKGIGLLKKLSTNMVEKKKTSVR